MEQRRRAPRDPERAVRFKCDLRVVGGPVMLGHAEVSPSLVVEQEDPVLRGEEEGAIGILHRPIEASRRHHGGRRPPQRTSAWRGIEEEESAAR